MLSRAALGSKNIGQKAQGIGDDQAEMLQLPRAFIRPNGEA